MTVPDPRIARFYDAAPVWQAELAVLRGLLLGAGLTETYKWRGPCYTVHGGNVATLWGFKDRCTLGFFKGVLLRDPEGILVPPGENSRSVRVVNFTAASQIEAQARLLSAYLAEAIANEAAGLRVAFPKDDLGWPQELLDAFDADPDLMAAFDALTPGRQRGWVLHFSQAKQAKTRAARIGKAAPIILAGKGMHDR